MKKAERMILESRTPDEYVENSLKSRLSHAEKAKLARLWMQGTGFNREDIIHARNRSEYWRKRKMAGTRERTKRRMAQHDYSKGKTIVWTRENIAEFLSLNRKDAYGRYLYRDWELAALFSTSIPSIQYLRRKFNKVSKMLGPGARRDKVIDYMSCSELVLQRGGPKALKSKR